MPSSKAKEGASGRPQLSLKKAWKAYESPERVMPAQGGPVPCGQLLCVPRVSILSSKAYKPILIKPMIHPAAPLCSCPHFGGSAGVHR